MQCLWCAATKHKLNFSSVLFLLSLSIAEMERLRQGFLQMGCNADRVLTPDSNYRLKNVTGVAFFGSVSIFEEGRLWSRFQQMEYIVLMVC